MGLVPDSQLSKWEEAGSRLLSQLNERESRIAELENAIAQHRLTVWGSKDCEVSSEPDAALYAHLQN
jgi:hypothetical protein